MKKHLIIHTLLTALACGIAAADETAKAEARAESKAVSSRTVTTTNVNGKPVTIIEEPDKDGKMHRKMITIENGKPKEKEITPKEKKPSPTPFSVFKPKAKAEVQKPAGEAQ